MTGRQEGEYSDLLWWYNTPRGPQQSSKVLSALSVAKYRFHFRPDYRRANLYRIPRLGRHIPCPIQPCQIPQAGTTSTGHADRTSLVNRGQGAVQGDAMWSRSYWIDFRGGNRSGGCFQVEGDQDALYCRPGIEQS